jgi:SAM-dependent methyltransferase
MAPIKARTERSPTPAQTPGAQYLAPYRAAVARVGAGFEALLWSSERSQRARFSTITRMTRLKGLVVVDAGCGRADLLGWLHGRGIEYGRYVGLDAVAELLEVGRAKGLPASEFHLVDFVADEFAFTRCCREPDVIVFSGSLNTMAPAMAMALLERAWRACGRALVFNFLTERRVGGAPGARPGKPLPAIAQADTIGHGPGSAMASKFDPGAMLRWALDRTARVSFRQGYLGERDATIGMRKARRRKPV